MHDEATQQQISGAEAYERLHVPALFQEWVEWVLEAAEVGPGQEVLDVACGTGVLARGAAGRVGRTGSVTGIDPDRGMLAVAERIAPSLQWEAGVAEALPFPDESFDAVVSQFGMMFFTDPRAAARQMLRVLRPGRSVAVAVWDSLENHRPYAIEVALLENLAGRAAADALRAPFVMGDPARLADLFEEAGAEDVVVHTRVGQARFPSVEALVGADLHGWLPLMGVELSDDVVDEILDRAAVAFRPFVTEQGTVEFPSPAHVLRARKA